MDLILLCGSKELFLLCQAQIADSMETIPCYVVFFNWIIFKIKLQCCLTQSFTEHIKFEWESFKFTHLILPPPGGQPVSCDTVIVLHSRHIFAGGYIQKARSYLFHFSPPFAFSQMLHRRDHWFQQYHTDGQYPSICMAKVHRSSNSWTSCDSFNCQRHVHFVVCHGNWWIQHPYLQ